LSEQNDWTPNAVKHAGFKYPMTLSGLGQAFSTVAAFVCCHVIKIVPAEKAVDMPFFLKRMLPVGLFMAVTLVCGNAVYMYLTVAFVQMLKAFTPVITMIGLFMVSLEVCLFSSTICQLLSRNFSLWNALREQQSFVSICCITLHGLCTMECCRAL
jgi:hypothetical protein